jgi:hypothetical protein
MSAEPPTVAEPSVANVIPFPRDRCRIPNEDEGGDGPLAPVILLAARRHGGVSDAGPILDPAA